MQVGQPRRAMVTVRACCQLGGAALITTREHSVLDCEQRCASATDCSFVAYWQHSCSLCAFAAVRPTAESSGVQREQTRSTFRPVPRARLVCCMQGAGLLYTSGPNITATADGCRAPCLATPGCRLFSFSPARRSCTLCTGTQCAHNLGPRHAALGYHTSYQRRTLPDSSFEQLRIQAPSSSSSTATAAGTAGSRNATLVAMEQLRRAKGEHSIGWLYEYRRLFGREPYTRKSVRSLWEIAQARREPASRKVPCCHEAGALLVEHGHAYNHSCGALCLARADCRHYSHFACEPSGKVCTAAAGACQLCSTLRTCSPISKLETWTRSAAAAAAATALEAAALAETAALPFRIVHGSADCCGGGVDVLGLPPSGALWSSAVGVAPSLYECARLCSITPGCTRLSHSAGQATCGLCASCKLVDSPSHTTWIIAAALAPVCTPPRDGDGDDGGGSGGGVRNAADAAAAAASAAAAAEIFVLVANNARAANLSSYVAPRGARVVRFRHVRMCIKLVHVHVHPL